MSGKISKRFQEMTLLDHVEDAFVTDGDVDQALRDYARRVINDGQLMERLEFLRTIATQRGRDLFIGLTSAEDKRADEGDSIRAANRDHGRDGDEGPEAA